MKQTAVEWFLNEFKKQVWFEENSELDIWINDLIPKAKEMEKEQIMKAFYKGRQEEQYKNLFNNHVRKSEEQYYKETYESKTKL